MELVTLGTYNSETEAQIVHARLEAEGIDSIVQADTGAGLVPSLAPLRGVRVLVRESELADAYEVLERMLPSGD